MPIIAPIGRKKWSVRCLLVLIYTVLSLGAVSILYPFALMIASSFTTRLDYSRFELVPLSLKGEPGRFAAYLAQRYDRNDWSIFQGNYYDPQLTFWEDLATDANGFFKRSGLGPIDEQKMSRYRDFLASLSPDEFGLYYLGRYNGKYEDEVYTPLTKTMSAAEVAKSLDHWMPGNGSYLQKDWIPPSDSPAYQRIRSFRANLPVEQRLVISGRILWIQWLQAYWSMPRLNALLGSHYQNIYEVPFLDPSCGMTFSKSACLRDFTGSCPRWRMPSSWGSSREWVDIPAKEYDYYLFHKNESGYLIDSLTTNYRTVFDYVFTKGRAAVNTLILVVLSVGTALTVNPLASYALARFRLRATPAIILFCLATSAFPAEVSMIPSFLLLKNLGMLNTFYALVLPGAANGFGIFLLKGFFESLPQELYEAAEIDGAGELRKFFTITVPLSAPIIAVMALGSFTAAYTGFMWAFIVAQDPKIWTLMVWLFQFQQEQTEYGNPSISMAALVVASMPTFLVFLFCQNIIMRGIIVPSMK